jgi:transposase
MVQGKEKTVVEKREILLHLRKGLSIRKISRSLKVHRDVIRHVQRTAAEHGWIDPSSQIPDNSEIERVICPKPNVGSNQLNFYAEKIKQWHTEGVNAVVIQRFLKEQYQCVCEISTLRRHIRRICPNLPDSVMVRQTKPGEVMDVDFGFLGKLWDESQNKLRQVWVFSGRLRHSRKAYRKLVWNQKVETFIKCHIFAFEHFGGVPEIVCLDNLKAGVIKSTIDNDMLNLSYRDLAEYYAFMISPCLPRTPEHKGGVENDVKYIKNNFWPQIRENTDLHVKNYP